MAGLTNPFRGLLPFEGNTPPFSSAATRKSRTSSRSSKAAACWR